MWLLELTLGGARSFLGLGAAASAAAVFPVVTVSGVASGLLPFGAGLVAPTSVDGTLEHAVRLFYPVSVQGT